MYFDVYGVEVLFIASITFRNLCWVQSTDPALDRWIHMLHRQHCHICISIIHRHCNFRLICRRILHTRIYLFFFIVASFSRRIAIAFWFFRRRISSFSNLAKDASIFLSIFSLFLSLRWLLVIVFVRGSGGGSERFEFITNPPLDY